MQGNIYWDAAKREAGSRVDSAYPDILTVLDIEKLEGGVDTLHGHISNLEKGKDTVYKKRNADFHLLQSRLEYLNRELVRHFVQHTSTDRHSCNLDHNF